MHAQVSRVTMQGCMTGMSFEQQLHTHLGAKPQGQDLLKLGDHCTRQAVSSGWSGIEVAQQAADGADGERGTRQGCDQIGEQSRNGLSLAAAGQEPWVCCFQPLQPWLQSLICTRPQPISALRHRWRVPERVSPAGIHTRMMVCRWPALFCWTYPAVFLVWDDARCHQTGDLPLMPLNSLSPDSSVQCLTGRDSPMSAHQHLMKRRHAGLPLKQEPSKSVVDVATSKLGH